MTYEYLRNHLRLFGIFNDLYTLSSYRIDIMNTEALLKAVTICFIICTSEDKVTDYFINIDNTTSTHMVGKEVCLFTFA